MSGCCRKKLQPHFVQKSRFLQFPAKTDTKPSASDINLVLQHLQQHVQLVLGHHHPQPVAGVHHEDDALAVSVVVLPQVPVSPLARHVECSEPNIAI